MASGSMKPTTGNTAIVMEEEEKSVYIRTYMC